MELTVRLYGIYRRDVVGAIPYKTDSRDACPYKLGGDIPPLHFTSSLFTLHYSLYGMSWAPSPTETDSRGRLSLHFSFFLRRQDNKFGHNTSSVNCVDTFSYWRRLRQKRNHEIVVSFVFNFPLFRHLLCCMLQRLHHK